MESVENRQIGITRILNGPIELVWQVWTQPEHIAQWWGPQGFTTTIHQMDFREGGEWRLTLHGPDGKDYANRSIFKEIVPQQKIVFEHFNPHFFTTVIFTVKGEQTEVDWSLLFDTAEMYDTIIKVHKADEGQKQNIEKLETYLAKLQA